MTTDTDHLRIAVAEAIPPQDRLYVIHKPSREAFYRENAGGYTGSIADERYRERVILEPFTPAFDTDLNAAFTLVKRLQENYIVTIICGDGYCCQVQRDAYEAPELRVTEFAETPALAICKAFLGAKG